MSSSSTPSSSTASFVATANHATYQYGLQHQQALCQTFQNSSLFDCALIVLNEPDPIVKAEKTFGIYRAYQEHLLVLTKPISSSLPLPSKPARPSYVQEVDARKVKSNSKKSMIHAVVHAESYAIDLAWDVIARYGYNPALWSIPNDIGISSSSSPSSSLTQAPSDFFDDWIRVAYEEAIHFTRWRLRLEELGSKYGDLPGHAGLWESAEETSYFAVSRMAIVHCVHEARGLDVAPIMRTKFEKSKDTASVEILDLNHADEIGHVQYGKKWFEWLLRYNGVLPPVTLTTATEIPHDQLIIEIFHKFVKKYFRGILRPPFNEKSRTLAGFTPAWYVPLSSSDFNPGQTTGKDEEDDGEEEKEGNE